MNYSKRGVPRSPLNVLRYQCLCPLTALYGRAMFLCSHILLGVVCVCSATNVFSQDVPNVQDTEKRQSLFLEGTVLDSTSGEGVVGALLRIVGANTGTYATAKGWFRLPLASAPSDANPLRLRITSLGYKPLEISISTLATASRTRFNLAPAPVVLGNVEVRALTADEIVRRAIAARAANAGNLNAVTTTIYTKINGFGILKIPFQGEKREEVIIETVARVEDTYKPKRSQKTTILQRRQTANIPAQNNIFAFNEFFNFLDDEVRIVNARLTTPLASNALAMYSYEYAGQRASGDGGTVYLLNFKPRTTAFPGFAGQLSIDASDYAVVEADFRPVLTDMTFVQSLRYKQKFTRYTTQGQTVWIPTYLQLNLRLATQALMGAAKAEGEFSAQSIVQNVNINAAAPVAANAGANALKSSSQTVAAVQQTTPPVPRQPKLRRKARETIVEPNADSARTEFWQKNSLYELTNEEAEVYRRLDSVERAKAAEEASKPLSAKKTAPSVGTRRSVSFSLNVGGGSGDDDDDIADSTSDGDTKQSRSAVGARTSLSSNISTNTSVPQSGFAPFSADALVPIPLSKNFTLGINPALNFTRVTNVLYGAELLPRFVETQTDTNGNERATGRSLTLSLRGTADANTPERRRFWGEAYARAEALSIADGSAADGSTAGISGAVFGGVFSRLNTIQERRWLAAEPLAASVLNPFNLNLEYLLFGHHLDFYREDGWTAGAGLNWRGFSLAGSYTQARNFGLSNTSMQEHSRPNGGIVEGTIAAWRVETDLNYPAPLSPLSPLLTETLQAGVRLYTHTKTIRGNEAVCGLGSNSRPNDSRRERLWRYALRSSKA